MEERMYGQVNMMYACITVLRALALLDGPQNIWKDYTKFESHLEERMKTEVYTKVNKLLRPLQVVAFNKMISFSSRIKNYVSLKVNKEKVVGFILHYLKLINKFSDLEIIEACGRLDTNCFEIKQHGVNLRAMYRIACIISHECMPNTRHTFGPDNSINLYATRNIGKYDLYSI